MKTFTTYGKVDSDFLRWFADGLTDMFWRNGYVYQENPEQPVRLVFNFIDPDKPRPYRRKAQATFVVSVLESAERPDDILKAAYPFLIRSLANHLLYLVRDPSETTVHFLTPEQGCYRIGYTPGEDEETFFQQVYRRLEPLASSRLVIDNEFHQDLPGELWHGDEITRQLQEAGKKLDAMNLLPAPFPIHEYLTPRDLQHLKKLYGIGGLSYGNLSSRRDRNRFWMSASGVDKGNLHHIGEDLLLIKGYNEEKNAMLLSVPPHVKPRRASVDAIEHWMIYSQHPEVGAIVHIHAWMDGVKATEINYPCGTLELAKTVARLIREEDDPSRAVIGLKNHGLTITGRNLDDIFERIEGKVIPQVPMA
ncbi:class II aldolase/adducin family protein [Bacillaceae bacterium]